MIERPILFSGPMVRAILDDRKTQTRRIINKLRGIGSITEFQASNTKGYDWTFRDRRMLWNDLRHEDLLARCPYGQPGDRLWVRETWCPDQYRADILDYQDDRLAYAADFKGEPGRKWRRSIHMPRWASRILLEITDVRVERLQEITNDDAHAEGLFVPECEYAQNGPRAAIIAFQALWGSIHAVSGLSWTANPYVWVIRFKRIAT